MKSFKPKYIAKAKNIVKPKQTGKEERSEERKFYDKAAWKNLRNMYILNNPICVMCKKEGKIKQGNVVDHIKPKRFYPELAYTESNFQTLCYECHTKKTMKDRKVYKY